MDPLLIIFSQNKIKKLKKLALVFEDKQEDIHNEVS